MLDRERPSSSILRMMANQTATGFPAGRHVLAGATCLILIAVSAAPLSGSTADAQEGTQGVAARDPETSVFALRCQSSPCIEREVVISVRTASPVPVRVQLMQGDVTAFELLRGPGRYRASLSPGIYRVCFTQDAAEGWAADAGCRRQTVRIQAQYDVRITRSAVRDGRARFVVVASGFAVGRDVTLIAETLRYRTYNDGSRSLVFQRSQPPRRTRLRRRQTFNLPLSPVDGQPSRLKLCVRAAVDPAGIRYADIMVRRGTDESRDHRGKRRCPS